MSTPKRILIVEDQRLIAADLENTLKKLGYQVMGSATEGSQAVKRAVELAPDLILMDIRLGGPMDGIEAAEQIRGRLDVPIVYLTAYADEETLLRAKVTSPFGYIVKPFNERELRAAVEIALYRHETERLLLDEQARRRAAEEFKLFVTGVQDYAIFMLDPSGRVASWNEGARRIHGYVADEIIGKHLSVFYPPEDRAGQQPEAILDTALAEGHSVLEGWRLRKDGSRFWASGVVTPIRDEEGELRGFGKVTRDLTERRRAEDERERLIADLKEALRIKGEFLATLSHELRTPLNAIIGWAHMIRHGADEASRTRGLEVIHRNAMVQNQLIADILDMQRISAGKLRLSLRDLEVAEVIHAALDTVRPAAEAKEISLVPVLDTGVGPILGDPDRLQQVIWNLLSNAVKFTPKGGRVNVRLIRINSHFEIEVEDSGPGIPPEFLPHVFERFRQGDSSSTRRHGGLGMGLAIVRSLVELHGGTVSVANRTVGTGASFAVKLPRRSVSPFQAVQPALERRSPTLDKEVWLADAPSLHGVKVLVIDDEPDAREVVAAVLSSCGADVLVASSAAEGMPMLERDRPDVILCDIEMPQEDGYRFIRRVRALPRGEGGRTPAAALTAYAGTEDRMKALRAGFEMHVPKPVQPAELATVVASLAERENAAADTRT